MMNGTLESLCDPALDDEAVFMFTSESVGEGHPECLGEEDLWTRDFGRGGQDPANVLCSRRGSLTLLCPLVNKQGPMSSGGLDSYPRCTES
ncbi:UNVERIFIED_CONTAM: hypothetical protein K2H54_013811 [Gekko kuhli]